MKIEIARQDDRMAPSGSAILRSLQNESLPIIDLVIRESFQNSLDARLPNKDYVKLDINMNTIETNQVSSFFKGITINLEEKFPKDSMVLSISDSNTTGLEGEFRTTDIDKLNQSNIYKLIYGINMNQQEGDAGGSWGLGKTSFFRLGSGIVVYYSRIKNYQGLYEERLAACLIEDSRKDDALMPTNPRGIAWWGDRAFGESEYDKTFPITDQDFIRRFLEKFKLEPYKDDQTGTTIIIPFIDENAITVKKGENALNGEIFWWEGSMEESIEIAIKRWYSPRLMNNDYKKIFNQPFLIAQINKRMITIGDNEHTFLIFSNLYKAALTNKSNDPSIVVKDIELSSLGMETSKIPIGRLAYIKTDMKKLGMMDEGALSPLAYIGEKNATKKNNAKILAYCRKPGMIVEYTVDDNEWMKGVSLQEGEYVFSFFVPNSDGPLNKKYQPKFQILENYLRETENADHANWTDIYIDKYSVTIIKRIKAQVSKCLSEDLGESMEVLSTRRTSSLSRKYGQMFMPKYNFGNSGSKTKKPPTNKKNPNKASGSKTSLEVTNVKFISNNHLEVMAELSLQKMMQCELGVNVKTTDRVLDSVKWRETFDNKVAYPFNILAVNVLSGDAIDTARTMSQTYVFSNNTENATNTRITFNLEILDLTMKPEITINNKRQLPEGRK